MSGIQIEITHLFLFRKGFIFSSKNWHQMNQPTLIPGMMIMGVFDKNKVKLHLELQSFEV